MSLIAQWAFHTHTAQTTDRRDILNTILMTRYIAHPRYLAQLSEMSLNVLSFKMILYEGNVCQMCEINSDKMMMVCTTMVSIYFVNVTASNEKKE